MTGGAVLVVEVFTVRDCLRVPEKRIRLSRSRAALAHQRSRGAHDEQSCDEKTCLHFMRRLLTGIGQAKREHIGARCDCEELLAVDAVRRRSSRDEIARVEMPQGLPGL